MAIGNVSNPGQSVKTISHHPRNIDLSMYRKNIAQLKENDYELTDNDKKLLLAFILNEIAPKNTTHAFIIWTNDNIYPVSEYEALCDLLDKAEFHTTINL